MKWIKKFESQEQDRNWFAISRYDFSQLYTKYDLESLNEEDWEFIKKLQKNLEQGTPSYNTHIYYIYDSQEFLSLKYAISYNAQKTHTSTVYDNALFADHVKGVHIGVGIDSDVSRGIHYIFQIIKLEDDWYTIMFKSKSGRPQEKWFMCDEKTGLNQCIQMIVDKHM